MMYSLRFGTGRWALWLLVLLSLRALTAVAQSPAGTSAPAARSLYEQLQLQLPAAPASYGSALADTLMHLHRIANNDFRPVAGPVVAGTYYSETHTVPAMLGADRVECSNHNNGRGLIFYLAYLKTNRLSRQACKDVAALFARLGTEGKFKLSLDKSGHFETGTLLLSGRPVLVYEQNNSGDAYYKLEITLYQYPVILADEAAYAGHFPAAPTASLAPQVWEVRGKGTTPNSYLRFNGLAKDGELVKGSKTFSGYDEYYEGVWYSEDWRHPNPNAWYLVRFQPAGTQDTVYGHFQSYDMFEMQVDGRSTHIGKRFANITTPIPAWVLAPHPVHQKLVAERRAAIAEYRRLHPEPTQTYSSPSSGSSSAPASRQYTPTEHVSRCIPCGGSGWVDGNDGMGHAVRNQCSSCGGSGKVTSRY